jgi:putative tricarboxylic transport membrane protein
VHGILAGPRLFAERADVAYTFMVGLMFTVVAMLIFGLVTIRWSSLIVRAASRFMVPGVLALSAIGTYGLRNSLFDVYVMIAIGVVGYLFTKFDIPLVTIALGLVLGSLTEQSFQQAAMVSMADTGTTWLYFFKRPLAVVLMLTALLVLGSGLWRALRNKPGATSCEAPSAQGRQSRSWLTLRTANLLTALGLIALSIYCLGEAREFSERGALFPNLLFAVILILGVVLFALNAYPKTGAAGAQLFPFAGVPWFSWCAIVAAFVLLGLAADRFGFYESAFVFLTVTTWIMSAGITNPFQRWLAPVGFALAFAAALYVVFRLILAVPTPPGVLL